MSAFADALNDETPYQPNLEPTGTAMGNEQGQQPAHIIQTGGPVRQQTESDLGNALLFVAQYGALLRFVMAWGVWLVWRGTHWEKDDTGEVFRRVKACMRALRDRAFDVGNLTDQQRLLKFATKSQSRVSIDNTIKLAQTEPGVVVTPAQLDSDQWVLNCQNGTLDLRTGNMREHRREDLHTKIVPANFNTTATCPQWLKFLNRITGGDAELMFFLKKAVGYSLTGDTSEQCLFYLFGLGRNGKSVFLEIIFYLFGKYAKRISSESLMVKQNGGGIPNDIAMLVGARLVVSSEVEEGAKLNETRVKELTGGDTVTARFLHQEYFEFVPALKPWICGNHKPVIRGTDLGIWRRIRLIPFTVTIPESEIDPHLTDKLRQELPGILAWAVQGCLAWQREGLKPPRVVVEATAAYRSESDLIGQFLDECCVLAPAAETSATVIYTRYKAWAETNGTRPITSSMLTRKLVERGIQTRRSSGTWFIGISVPAF